jgi:hypothetical protein
MLEAVPGSFWCQAFFSRFVPAAQGIVCGPQRPIPIKNPCALLPAVQNYRSCIANCKKSCFENYAAPSAD